jgi:hypothetical protein
VYADEVAALCAEGAVAPGHQPPEDTLFTWLRAFIAHVAAKRHLALAIPGDQGSGRSALFGQWHEAMRSTLDRLLTRAQSAGAVREGLNVSDLLVVASGIAVAAADAEQAERCLAVLRHGVAR